MKLILVVDDSPTIRTSVEYTVKGIGFSVVHAENGADALEKVSEIKGKGDDISLCIVDVNMPIMDGISFLKEFKKDDKFTPILMLTTESEEGKIQEGKKFGASGWMTKPFKPQNLIETVKKLVP